MKAIDVMTPGAVTIRPDADITDAIIADVGKRALHSLSLRIEHRFLGRNNDSSFHSVPDFPAACLLTSLRECRVGARNFLLKLACCPRLIREG